jgi:hypothetical protein
MGKRFYIRIKLRDSSGTQRYKINAGTGAGVYGYGMRQRFSFSLGQYTMVLSGRRIRYQGMCCWEYSKGLLEKEHSDAAIKELGNGEINSKACLGLLPIPNAEFPKLMTPLPLGGACFPLWGSRSCLYEGYICFEGNMDAIICILRSTLEISALRFSQHRKGNGMEYWPCKWIWSQKYNKSFVRIIMQK